MTWANAKIKKRYVGTEKVRPSSRLPSAYQEVEYIQSSWTQYIDTLFKFTQTTWWIDIKFRPTNLSWAWSDYRLMGSYVDNKRPFLIYCGSTAPRLWVGSVTQQLWTIAVNNDYALKATVSTAWTCNYTFNWTSSSFTYSWTIVNNYNIALFANNDVWTIWQYWSWRLYYLKITDWTTLVRDFVPCYRKLDSVIWLYDLANSAFYINSWSWTFTKWWNVN